MKYFLKLKHAILTITFIIILFSLFTIIVFSEQFENEVTNIAIGDEIEELSSEINNMAKENFDSYLNEEIIVFEEVDNSFISLKSLDKGIGETIQDNLELDINQNTIDEVFELSQELSAKGIKNLDLESKYGLSTKEAEELKRAILKEREKDLKEIKLAEIKSNDKYKDKFLEWNDQYSDIDFIKPDIDDSYSMIVGNKIDNIIGFEINEEGYAIELLACDYVKKACAFRVNGAPTKMMTEGKTEFKLTKEFSFMIIKIEFDKCDYTVCDPIYDVFDMVQIEVIGR